jgi:hypothetical protein
MTWRATSAWPDPSALFEALGAEIVHQRAYTGEGEAQFSLGCLLVSRAEGDVALASDVGLALSTYEFRLEDSSEARRCGILS